ncbi:MAG: AbrB/MazE/SpoVT family DNA-binding domain-containing protein [archaeon YNP-LCB-024-027]|nr:AbrB/MazE/SpoVT family DNA-binding domain-containing protein [Candidatus Culexarchaeum yellowstonense]
MVKLKLKIGPKGQIVIPKILREKYGIRENGYVLVEVRDEELAIIRAPSIEETLEWIKLRRGKLKAKQANLGDLAEVDLEEEFNEDIRGC